jgi:hypothetical protein
MQDCNKKGKFTPQKSDIRERKWAEWVEIKNTGGKRK